jgi:large subunit ribosomal protein L21
MFAVIKTGGKQYKVAAEDEIVVMTLPGEAGTAVTFEEVLSFSDGGTTEVGVPFVSGASVAAEIVGHKRGPKVIAFKKRRRKNSRRKRGHRQDLTVLRITEILTAGQKPSGRRSTTAAAQADVPAAHSPETATAEAVA